MSANLQQGFDEGTAAIAVVNEQLRNVTGTLSDIKEVLKHQSDQLAKLAVIEERNLSIQQSLDRAFGAIEKSNESADERAAANDAANKDLRADLEQHKNKTSRWVYTVTGFVGAVTLVWALFGWAFIDTAKVMVEITQAYKYGRFNVPPVITPAP